MILIPEIICAVGPAFSSPVRLATSVFSEMPSQPLENALKFLEWNGDKKVRVIGVRYSSRFPRTFSTVF
jgi:hypothetical protein